MKHSFVSTKADPADPTLIGSTDWNGVHVVGVTTLSANTTLTASHDFVKAVGGTLGITLTLPSAPVVGARYEIKKVDAGVGAVTIVGSIDGQSSYILGDQYQYVVVNWDGTVWHVVGRN